MQEEALVGLMELGTYILLHEQGGSAGSHDDRPECLVKCVLVRVCLSFEDDQMEAAQIAQCPREAVPFWPSRALLLMFPIEDVCPESHARKEAVADVSWASCGHASTDLVSREVYGVGPSFDGRCKARLANQ